MPYFSTCICYEVDWVAAHFKNLCVANIFLTRESEFACLKSNLQQLYLINSFESSFFVFRKSLLLICKPFLCLEFIFGRLLFDWNIFINIFRNSFAEWSTILIGHFVEYILDNEHDLTKCAFTVRNAVLLKGC